MPVKKVKVMGLGLGKLLFVLSAAVVMAVCGSIFGQPYIETATAVFSIIALMYLVEGKLAGCVCGAIYNVVFATICFSKGIYGLMWFNLAVSLPMFIISVFTWKNNKHGDKVAARRLSARKLALILAAAAAVCAGGYFILRAVGSVDALFDGFTLTMASFGNMLLSLRYVEQWYFNIAANTGALVLWIILTAQDISNLSFVISALIFVVSCVMALVSWIKMEREQRLGEV